MLSDAAVREWSVVGLGAALLAASVSYLAVGGVSGAAFVRLGVPIGLSLFLVAFGVWLRASDRTGALAGAVFRWCLAGATVMGLLAGWVSLLRSVHGLPMLQPPSIVLTKVALGGLGGGLLGTYACRLRRRTEELAEQRNRLDEFASIVSHDLRNPLNVAQGHLGLARETGDDRHFEAVERAHDRMERLVDEVLALSRRGDTVDDPRPVELAAAAREAWDTVETHGMELDVDADRTVVCDGRRLRALFENLFRNAVEHSSTGRQTQSDDAVEHGSTSSRPEGDDVHQTESDVAQQNPPDSADAADRGGDRVAVGALDSGFYVEDDGPGIPPGDRERVFEGGYSTRADGTGFGLAIVRRIAEAHDWEVRVTESEWGGARFEFRE